MKIDFLEQVSNYQKTKNVNIFWGNDVPTSPADGDLWFEDTITGTQASGTNPWIYNTANSLWLSQAIYLPFPVQILTTETDSYRFYPVRTYGSDSNKVYVQFFLCEVLNLSGTAHSSTNYWDIKIMRVNSSGTQLEVWDSPSNTGFNFGSPSGLPANSPRHIQFAVETFIDGRTWDIGVKYIKVGTPPTAGISIASQIVVRFGRS